MDLANGSPKPPTTPRTVVLVHGIWDSSRIFLLMARFLKMHGFAALAPDLTPSNGDLSLEQLAAQVAAYVETYIPAGEQVDLVGFSMGGLVSRYYVQRLGGIERVRRLITLSHSAPGNSVGAYIPQSRQPSDASAERLPCGLK